jgi:hypothetical protein
MIRNDDRYNNLLFAIIIQAICDLLIDNKQQRTEFIVAKQDAKVFLFDKTSDNHQGFIALCFMLDIDYNYVKFSKTIDKIINYKTVNNFFSFDQIKLILQQI